MLEARRRTLAAVREITGEVTPGMTEEEGLELARRTLRAHGFERDWAAPYLRFGVNTLKKYGDPSEPGVVLGRNDVWFVDVGPLWRNHECDYAETCVVGDDPARHRLVRDVHDDLRPHRPALARVACNRRRALPVRRCGGWRPRLAARPRDGRASHRQRIRTRYSTTACSRRPDFTPSAGLWMLEIQLRHPDLPYSAFIEDLLLDPADD